MKPKIFLKVKGASKSDVEHILQVITECYTNLPHNLDAVEVNIFQSSSDTLSFLAAQSNAAGVKSSGFDEEFYAYHHAWLGLPTITISVEKLKTLTQELADACIRHEVAHSVLHGEIRDYVIPTPIPYRRLKEACKLSDDYLLDLTYLTAVAVKDYEATKLLYLHNYRLDQLRYAEHLLDEGLETTLWKIVEHHRQAKALFLTSSLKVPFCVKPLLDQENIRLQKKLESYLQPLRDYRRLLMEVVDESAARFTDDTYSNIQRAAEIHCEKILKEILTQPVERNYGSST
jgi:hypothetical protein